MFSLESLSVGVIINKMAYLHSIHPRCRIFLWISLNLVYHQFIPWDVIRGRFYYCPNCRANKQHFSWGYTASSFYKSNSTEFLPRARKESLDSPGWNVHSWMLKTIHCTIDTTISHSCSVLWGLFLWVVREVDEGPISPLLCKAAMLGTWMGMLN